MLEDVFKVGDQYSIYYPDQAVIVELKEVFIEDGIAKVAMLDGSTRLFPLKRLTPIGSEVSDFNKETIKDNSPIAISVELMNELHLMLQNGDSIPNPNATILGLIETIYKMHCSFSEFKTNVNDYVIRELESVVDRYSKRLSSNQIQALEQNSYDFGTVPEPPEEELEARDYGIQVTYEDDYPTICRYENSEDLEGAE